MRSLQFIQTIGAGAFGTVYLCRVSTPRGFQKQAALKVLHGQANAGMFLTRIRDEARLLGLLRDSAIIKVLDLLEIHGRQAVLMEYVEGADLESIVEQEGCPPPRALAEITAVVAGALSRAHLAVHPTTGEALNVIHRDVKPANIMVGREGAVKLLDFGVARARFDARESFTGQLVLGTLNYMAPEYVVTGEVTTAADVYGLGLALWQAATGKVYGQPKVRKKDHEARLEERVGELPATHKPLAAVLREMLAWEPERRPSAAQVEEALDDVQRDLNGPSLRTWARAVIPSLLLSRPLVPDEAGLVGTVHEIEDGLDPDAVAGHPASGASPTLDPIELSPTDKHDTLSMVEADPSISLLDPFTDEVELTESSEVTEAGASPAASPPPADSPSRPVSTPLSAPVLKGLLIGVAMGLVILAITAAVMLGIKT